MAATRARWLRVGILLVVLLAFGLRLYAVDRQDIWGDEAFSIWLSSQPLPAVVAGGADTHPPFYPFLLYLWLRLAGSSPLAVRTLSAFIGTLTVSLVYALGRRVRSLRRFSGGGPALGRGALLAALLAAASPILVYYSQETRMYGLVTLLAAASVYWAMRTCQEQEPGEPRRTFRSTRFRGGAGPWLAYFLTTLGAAYTHYYAFFVILAENLVNVPFLLRERRWPTLRRWLAAQGALAVAYAPWIAVQSGFLSGKASVRFDEWNLATALRIARETLAGFGAGLAVPLAVSSVAALLYLVAVLVGLLAAIRRHRTEPWLIAAYFFVPLLLAWAVNPIMPFFYARYLLLVAPAFYLLAAWGVMGWGRLWRPLGVVVAAILLAASSYGLHGYYTDEAYDKGRYGQMMAFVQANARSGDGLILANRLQRPIFEYYQPAGFVDAAYFFPAADYDLEDPRTARALEEVASQHPRLWLVRFGNPAEYDPDDTLTRWLAAHGSKAYFGGWVDADLSLYVMAPGTTEQAIQHPLRAYLGDKVELLGYSLTTSEEPRDSAGQVAAGDTLLLSLYWQALSPMTVRYTVFTHLLDAQDQIAAQMDSEPQGGGLPTDRWAVGQVVKDNYALAVPADAVPGTYVLEAGMYTLSNLERLPVRDPDSGTFLGDRVLLATVEVGAP
jgi:mannosyltransferase